MERALQFSTVAKYTNSLEQKLPVSNALTYLDLKVLKPLFKRIKYKVTSCLVSGIKPAKLSNAAIYSSKLLRW